MKQGGIILRTNDGYEAVFERHLRHPPERVWAMITDPKQIPKWYMPTEIEPRVGGRIVERHDNVGATMIGKITRYEPPRVFEHTWGAADEDEETMGSVLWELTPEGGGTKLVLRNRFSELEGAYGTMTGWHIFVDVLADVLDGADPSVNTPPGGTYHDGEFTQTRPGRGRWADHAAVEAKYKSYVARVAAERTT